MIRASFYLQEETWIRQTGPNVLKVSPCKWNISTTTGQILSWLLWHQLIYFYWCWSWYSCCIRWWRWSKWWWREHTARCWCWCTSHRIEGTLLPSTSRSLDALSTPNRFSPRLSMMGGNGYITMGKSSIKENLIFSLIFTLRHSCFPNLNNALHIRTTVCGSGGI